MKKLQEVNDYDSMILEMDLAYETLNKKKECLKQIQGYKNDINNYRNQLKYFYTIEEKLNVVFTLIAIFLSIKLWGSFWDISNIICTDIYYIGDSFHTISFILYFLFPFAMISLLIFLIIKIKKYTNDFYNKQMEKVYHKKNEPIYEKINKLNSCIEEQNKKINTILKETTTCIPKKFIYTNGLNYMWNLIVDHRVNTLSDAIDRLELQEHRWEEKRIFGEVVDYAKDAAESASSAAASASSAAESASSAAASAADAAKR